MAAPVENQYSQLEGANAFTPLPHLTLVHLLHQRFLENTILK